jgi:hypothetical protein
MKALLVTLLALSSAAAVSAQQTVDYRFDEIKRKVVLTSAQRALPVAKGQHARGGDKVETGWFSYALIASEQHRVRFELFGSTEVQLASGTPGVILTLERGRIHALFDKITGTEPRVVQTPGALLAVRGTQYDVEVDENGRTTLNVFEGTVEVRTDLRPEPLLIHAGEAARFSRREMPEMRPPNRRNEKDPAMDPGKRAAAGKGDSHDGHGTAQPPGDHGEHGQSPSTGDRGHEPAHGAAPPSNPPGQPQPPRPPGRPLI